MLVEGGGCGVSSSDCIASAGRLAGESETRSAFGGGSVEGSSSIKETEAHTCERHPLN